MKAIVDRIEHDLAILLLEPDEDFRFTLPAGILPGIGEGDIVEILITKDETATRDSRNKSIELIERLKS